jgi:hypothetical protein
MWQSFPLMSLSFELKTNPLFNSQANGTLPVCFWYVAKTRITKFHEWGATYTISTYFIVFEQYFHLLHCLS